MATVAAERQKSKRSGVHAKLGLTAYRLLRMAQVRYPPLSQAVVHDFLKGRRQIELPSVEALLATVDLRVVRKNGKR